MVLHIMYKCYAGSGFLICCKAQAISEWRIISYCSSKLIRQFASDLEVGVTDTEVTLNLVVNKLSFNPLKVLLLLHPILSPSLTHFPHVVSLSPFLFPSCLLSIPSSTKMKEFVCVCVCVCRRGYIP